MPAVPWKQTVRHVALRALAKLERRSPAAGPIENFLILQHPKALGTAIHATPLIAALRRASPQGRIFVAASGVGYDALRNNPHIDALIAVTSPVNDARAGRRELAAVVRSFTRGMHGPWATITPSGSERTSIAVTALLAGARNRIGFTLAPELYTQASTFAPSRSLIANNLRIVAACGYPSVERAEPEIFFTTEDSEYASALLAGRNSARPLIALVTQTSITQRKSWRKERFVAAADALHAATGAECVLVGTAAEYDAVEEIRGQLRAPSWNAAGRTDLQQLAALLAQCDVGLTLDTGTLHVGRAVALPMAIIAPAWSPPLEWLPIDNPRFVILKNADMDAATPEYIIDEVSVDEAVAAVLRLLEQWPRDPR
jgi:ADP-heptose:LPS heptosyltransferase